MLYASDVYGIILGETKLVICGGTLTTLGEGAAGWQGGQNAHGGMALSCWGLVSLS